MNHQAWKAKTLFVLGPSNNFKIQRYLRTFSFPTIMSTTTNHCISENENVEHLYKNAILKLNSLQSNYQVRAKWALDHSSGNSVLAGIKSLQEMHFMLKSIGITINDLESLNTIHVSGTKGKGSTCAFTESILRHAGLKTGFYSSPHLIMVRERIRINGSPISKEKFAKYFFQVYSKFTSCKEKDSTFQIPAYFRFLTCMAFHTFLQEKVDVAIMEVGIGGRYDCTNVIPNPAVVGITTLGLEHQELLGNTLSEIAANKAGIMKPNCPAFTVNSHPEHIFKLLKDNATDVKCSLHVAPDLSELSLPVHLGVGDETVSKLNASLAVQLASSFMNQKFPEKTDPLSRTLNFSKPNFNISSYHVEGLKNANWFGRFQTIMKENVKFYLDGAHTIDSLKVALNWFQNTSCDKSFRILIFSMTGQRTLELLTPFADAKVFNIAIFCPVTRRQSTIDNDNWSSKSLGENQLESCKKYSEFWKSRNQLSPCVILGDIDSAMDFVHELSTENEKTKTQYLELYQNTNEKLNSKEFSTVEVLITGSLHLVGNVLSILDPSIVE